MFGNFLCCNVSQKSAVITFMPQSKFLANNATFPFIKTGFCSKPPSFKIRVSVPVYVLIAHVNEFKFVFPCMLSWLVGSTINRWISSPGGDVELKQKNKDKKNSNRIVSVK